MHIETKLLLVAMLPILSLVLLLSWAFLVITRRSNVKIALAGFGVKIQLDSSDNRPNTLKGSLA